MFIKVSKRLSWLIVLISVVAIQSTALAVTRTNPTPPPPQTPTPPPTYKNPPTPPMPDVDQWKKQQDRENRDRLWEQWRNQQDQTQGYPSGNGTIQYNGYYNFISKNGHYMVFRFFPSGNVTCMDGESCENDQQRYSALESLATGQPAGIGALDLIGSGKATYSINGSEVSFTIGSFNYHGIFNDNKMTVYWSSTAGGSGSYTTTFIKMEEPSPIYGMFIYERLFKNHPLYAIKQKEMADEVAETQKEFDQKSANMSDADKKAYFNQLQDRLNAANQSKIQEIQTKIDQAINAVCKERGLAGAVDTTAIEAGKTYIDISDDVIKKF